MFVEHRTGMRLIVLALALAAAAAAQEPYSKLRNEGPLGLAILYRCNLDQRTALRDAMTSGGGVARFQNWKERNVLKDYHILFNSYLDSETYDMVALLSFDDYAGVGRWREIEKHFPGGLGTEALKYITSAVTYSLDAVRSGASETAATRGHSVFFLIPYEVQVSMDDYVKYADTYVIPQLEGWIRENVLADYTIFLSRYSTGRTFDTLFVLEYRDSDAFGKREATVAKVRAQLRANPAWLAASESKQKIRVEKQTIVAEELVSK